MYLDAADEADEADEAGEAEEAEELMGPSLDAQLEVHDEADGDGEFDFNKQAWKRSGGAVVAATP